MIGADFVAKSAPDGYTLLFSDSAAYVINPSLYAKMPYHPMSDLAPITVVCRLAPVLAISNAVPARSVPELIAYAQVHPGALSYGSFGSGSYPHVVMEQFKQMAGVDILHVPYKGSSPAVTDMIGGRLSMLLVTLSVFDQQEKAGKLKILAAATEHRLSLRPDLPTIAESVPGYSVSVWFGMAAPAGTPQRLIDRIYADLAGLLADPAFNEQFLKPQGLEPGGETPVAFAARWQTETVRWATLVRASGAKVE
jgi:tripartite-type tricarboxylate transporter receptor subunit TctC